MKYSSLRYRRIDCRPPLPLCHTRVCYLMRRSGIVEIGLPIYAICFSAICRPLHALKMNADAVDALCSTHRRFRFLLARLDGTVGGCPCSSLFCFFNTLLYASHFPAADISASPPPGCPAIPHPPRIASARCARRLSFRPAPALVAAYAPPHIARRMGRSAAHARAGGGAP